MPAGNTYEAIFTETASAVSSVTFSSIPSTYTDLVCIVQAANSTNTDLGIRFNGDTASNYSVTLLVGNGSSATSTRYSSQNEIYLDITGTQTGQMTYIVNVQNYSNATTYKTTLTRYSNAGVAAEASVGLWRSTAAINSVTIKNGAGTFTGQVTLYGILAA